MARVKQQPNQIMKDLRRQARQATIGAPVIGLTVSTVMVAMLYLSSAALAALIWGWPPFPVLGWPALIPGAFLAASAWGSWRMYSLTYGAELARLKWERMEQIRESVRQYENQQSGHRRPKPRGTVEKRSDALVYHLDRYRGTHKRG